MTSRKTLAVVEQARRAVPRGGPCLLWARAFSGENSEPRSELFNVGRSLADRSCLRLHRTPVVNVSRVLTTYYPAPRFYRCVCATCDVCQHPPGRRGRRGGRACRAVTHEACPGAFAVVSFRPRYVRALWLCGPSPLAARKRQCTSRERRDTGHAVFRGPAVAARALPTVVEQCVSSCARCVWALGPPKCGGRATRRPASSPPSPRARAPCRIETSLTRARPSSDPPRIAASRAARARCAL